MAKPKKPAIAATMEDGSPVVEVFAIKMGDDGQLVMDCKALGSMRMDVIVTADSIAAGWPVIMNSKKAIMAFAKQIPAALKKAKKAAKEAEAAKAAKEADAAK